MGFCLTVLLTAAAFWLAVLAFFGVGLLLIRAMRWERVGVEDMPVCSWLGWGVVVACLQVWHLVFPVNGWAVLLVILAGGFGWVGYGRAGFEGWPTGPRAAWVCVLLVLSSIWLALQTTTMPALSDSGLYHIPAIKWIGRYAIVPGLGNLHDWLAFNNIHFLYGALIDAAWFSGKSHHVTSGVLFLLMLIRIGIGFYRVCVSPGAPRPHHIFDATFLVPVLWHAEGGYEFASSPTPDIAVYALSQIVCSELLRLLERGQGAGPHPEAGHARQDAFACFSMMFLSAIGFAVKPSFATTGFVAPCLAVCVVWARHGKRQIRALVLGLAACICVAGPWIVRGIVTSGYPFYPSDIGACPVDWRMPLARLEANRHLIRAWAHKMGAVDFDAVTRGDASPYIALSQGWDWLWLWFNQLLRKPFEGVVPLALTFGFAPLVWLLWKGDGSRHHVTVSAPWGFLLVPVSGLLTWFFSVPSLRFGSFLFWALAAAALAMVLPMIEKRCMKALVLLLTLVLFTQNINLLAFIREYRRDAGPVQAPPMHIRVTDSGLEVRVPDAGRELWNAPLPSTPYFNPGLSLRVPGDLSRGFRMAERASDGTERPAWQGKNRKRL